jgi:hypothetical protein
MTAWVVGPVVVRFGGGEAFASLVAFEAVNRIVEPKVLACSEFFIASRIVSFTCSKIASVAQGQIMTDPIPDIAVVLSLLREAASLLDRPEYARAAAHLQDAIAELSQQKQDEPSDDLSGA